jgi:hypothetical protein
MAHSPCAGNGELNQGSCISNLPVRGDLAITHRKDVCDAERHAFSLPFDSERVEILMKGSLNHTEHRHAVGVGQ